MDVHIFYYTLFYALPPSLSLSLSLPLSTVCLAISIYYPTQTHAHTLPYLPIAHIHALVYSFKCPFYICTTTMNVGRKEEKGYTIKCCPCICIRFLFRMCLLFVVIVPRYHTKKRITSTDGTCKDGCSLRSMYWLKHSGFWLAQWFLIFTVRGLLGLTCVEQLFGASIRYGDRVIIFYFTDLSRSLWRTVVPKRCFNSSVTFER